MFQNIQRQIQAEEREENAKTRGPNQDPEKQGAEVQGQQPAGRDGASASSEHVRAPQSE